MTALLLPALLWPFFWSPDPAPGLNRSKAKAERYVCTDMAVEAGRDRRPGWIEPARPRGDYVERNVMICQEQLVDPDLLHPRDAAILAHLQTITHEIATAAAADHPQWADRTWLVEAYYPSAQVSPKITFATQAALLRAGVKVSDRSPRLAAGDVDVLTRMEPTQAYPSACRRYTDNGSLRPDDVLLALVHRDPRETILHAGVCADGQWWWLR